MSDQGETSKAFNRFVDNRGQCRASCRRPRPATPTPATYGYNSQDVLLPAFLDAYRGKSSDGYSAKTFEPSIKIPIPNWNITYNGLSELPFVQRYFRSFRLNHVYSSVYNIAGYNTSANYGQRARAPRPDSKPGRGSSCPTTSWVRSPLPSGWLRSLGSTSRPPAA